MTTNRYDYHLHNKFSADTDDTVAKLDDGSTDFTSALSPYYLQFSPYLSGTPSPDYLQLLASGYEHPHKIAAGVSAWPDSSADPGAATAPSQPATAAAAPYAAVVTAAASVDTSAVSAASSAPATATTHATVTGIDTQIQVAIGSNLVNSLYGITGTGEKIGVISDSFNINGGEATDIANGALPSNENVLKDGASGGTDEGRAMTEVAYAVAPGASYDFYTGDGSAEGFAAAVNALQAAGCTIIVDDLTVGGEVFYQTGSAADIAINTAVAANVDYFTSASNNGNDYYESGFTPLTVSIPGISASPVVANNFGGNSPYLSVTIAAGSAVNGVLGFAQPAQSYGSGANSAQNSLAEYLLDSNGNVVASSTDNDVGGDPLQGFNYTNNTGSTNFRIVVVQNGGTVPAGELFKFIWYNNDGTINNASAGMGSGTLQGHEFLPGLNSVAAVDYSLTPANGTAVAPIEASSSVGPGKILYDGQGNLLATPIVPNEPQFAAPDGTTTASANSPGFASMPFFGTSAAAPASAATAALMLQANGKLTTTQVTNLLEQSVTPVISNGGFDGAGLIQARAAVELASASGQDSWTSGSGGNWNAATWTTGAAPTTAQAAYIDDNLGTISNNYTVTVNTGGDVAGAIALAAPSSFTATLDITAGGSLAVGGSTATDPTANDFLVSDGGILDVTGGNLSVARSLNVNNGTVNITSGSLTAGDYTQDAGTATFGSTTTLTDATGFDDTGGSAMVLAGATVSTTLLTLSSATLTDAGSFLDTGALTIGANGTAGSILLDAGAQFSIGGTTDAEGISFAGPATLDFTSTNVTVTSLGLNSIISNFTNTGDVIGLTGFTYDALDSFSYTPGTSGTAGDLFVFDSTGTNIAQINFSSSGNYSNASFQLKPDANNRLEITATCYCPGTMIGTDRGEVAIEELRIGDTVITHSGAVRPIRWIGHRHIDLTRHIAPEKVRPVRILAHAFADAAPRRDLLVSPDHALFIDGKLIPAKLLVNEASIIWEAECRHVTYLHVELDSHDILLAEGLPAESYLDTGNRAMFANAGVPMVLHPDLTNDQARRRVESCAPFADDPAQVELVWRALAVRATQLGLRLPAEPETTDDPALCLFVDGRRLTPVSVTHGRHVFLLQRVAAEVRLLSRSTEPTTTAPWVADDRCLGVLVRGLSLRSGAEVRSIPLDHPALTAGWWQPEWHSSTALRRWTNGDAVVPMAGLALAEAGPWLLEVDVADTMHYPLRAAMPGSDDRQIPRVATRAAA